MKFLILHARLINSLGTSQLYHGFLIAHMVNVPLVQALSSLELYPQEDIRLHALRVQIPYTLESHDTTMYILKISLQQDEVYMGAYNTRCARRGVFVDSAYHLSRGYG